MPYLTQGWYFKLEQTRKKLLLEVDRKKLSEAGKEGAKITNSILHGKPLSKVDKPREETLHNIRQEIADSLGWSTGKVAMANKSLCLNHPPA